MTHKFRTDRTDFQHRRIKTITTGRIIVMNQGTTVKVNQKKVKTTQQDVPEEEESDQEMTVSEFLEAVEEQKN